MKFKQFFSKISYAIIPFFIFVATLLISYFGNQILYNLGITRGSTYPKIEIDDQIPFIPWFIYFYFLTFPLGIIAFFYLAYTNKKAFYNLYITLLVSFILSGIIYFFGQTYFVKPDFEPKTFTDKFVVWTWGSTNPINCFPSQHCFMAFAIILGCTAANSNGNERKMSRIFVYLAIFCAIMIVLATVFIKQHYFLDIIASFDIMLITYGIVCSSNSGDKLRKRHEQIREKRKLKKIQKNINITDKN